MQAVASKRNCAFCVGILIDYKIKHTEDACPLRASLHCTYCCKYGHTTSKCPTPPPDSVYTTSPSGALEQLRRRKAAIAAEKARATENIEKDSWYYPAKELLENEKVLREFVRINIKIPAVKIERNKEHIKKWAAKNGVNVRYIKEVACEDIFAEYDRIYEAANPKTTSNETQTHAA